MAYQGATFYINLVSGSDAARTALTSCTASNPSGTITRINKTAHGLVTGAVVDLSLFSSWLNNAFKITVVDADNFDLDDTVWQTTADASGTVTPRGGSSWSDAWLTVSGGATAARTQPGDTIRLAKTADPVSLAQNATFTLGSSTATLTSAVTKKVEDAISGWTAATNVTAGTSTTRKLGATRVDLTPAGAFTTGKMAYATVSGGGTQDFSSYQKISFWFRVSAACNASDYSVCLCSDATGDTPVETFNIPAIAGANMVAFTFDKGSALSSSVQSVAVYANVDPGTRTCGINNIFATNNLSLNTLIGINGHVFYPIKAIDGTSVELDAFNSSTAAGGLKGYAEATTTETVYYREMFNTGYSASAALTPPEGGSGTYSATAGMGFITYIGGWNTGSNTRDGYTFFDGSCGTATGLSHGANFVSFQYLGFARYSTGFAAANSGQSEIKNCIFTGNSTSVNTQQCYKLFTENIVVMNGSASAVSGTVGSRVRHVNMLVKSIQSTPVITGAGSITFYKGEMRNNITNSISATEGSPDGDVMKFDKFLFDGTVQTSFSAGGRDSIIWSFAHDNVEDDHRFFAEGITQGIWQTAEKQGSDPGAWKIDTLTSARSVYYPLKIKVATPVVNADTLVTVKVWIKKSHATNIGAKIGVDGYSLNGVSETFTNKANDTNWEQLTLTFTPTEKGAIPVYAYFWHLGANADAYIGSVEITQA